MEKMPIPATPGSKDDASVGADYGQKAPSDSNAVKQRHQIGEPVKPNAWDCSAILLGQAVGKGEPGAVEHTGVLPFAFYEIKSENQPSAGGATTRPEAKKA